MRPGRPTVAIVGAGASGVLTALAFLALPGTDEIRVVLYERTGRPGAGVAFSTAYESHLLNVAAGAMSAYADDPAHFACWLGERGVRDAQDAFVERKFYQQYLQEALFAAACRGAGRSRGDGAVVEVVHDDVVDIVPEAGGAHVVTAGGRPAVRASAVVLASGLVEPSFPDGLVRSDASHRCVADPWRPGALGPIEHSATVTLLGTGLTAVDVLLALRESGHRGPLRAISRHGLLPCAHTAPPRRAPPRPRPGVALVELCQGRREVRARALFHAVRQASRAAAELGGDWRDVIDLLRPRAQALWQRMSPAEQARFRRHVERYWSVHRHRMAPDIALKVEQLRETGAFHVHAGRVVSAAGGGPSLRLEVELRATKDTCQWATDWLVNCTGPGTSPFGGDHVLLNALRERGLVLPGPLDIGLGTDLSGRALGAGGPPIRWLWAIGSLRQGQLLESTAVPEIRLQAREVALQVRQLLRRPPEGQRALSREYLAARL
jgi:uncharacterized NAD(P)/FAD-binding protein YdhS